MSDQVADLYVMLRADSAPMTASFTEAGAAGERLAIELNAAAAEASQVWVDAAGRMRDANGRFVAANSELAASAQEMATGTTAAIEEVIAKTDGMSAAMIQTIDELNAQYTALGLKAGATAEEIDAANAKIAEGWTQVAASAKASTDEVVASSKTMAAQVELDSAAMSTRAGEAGAAAEAMGAKMDKASAGVMQGGLLANSGFTKAALGAGIAGGAAIKMAGDFQQSTTKLTTSASLPVEQLKQVQDGILSMAGSVGYSAEELSAAMYKTSSGVSSIAPPAEHASASLQVLKAAAQGAKAEGSDLSTVADAVTTSLIDFHQPASAAADVTSKLVGATAQGKMSFEELAGSLSNVAPVASAAHISMDDMLGTLASMTSHGISAQQATQNMSDAIRHLQNPTSIMRTEMASFGISADDVAAKLGERGLSGTMQYLQQAVAKAMPPGTDKVILDLKNAVSQSSPAVQDLANKVMDGSMSMAQFTKAAKALDPIQAKQATSFATLAGQTHQLGSEQMTGAQALQTYGGAMSKMMGDATGLKVALMTTGENAQNTNDAIKAVSDSTADAAGNVKGWDEIQGEFNTKVSQAKDGLEAMATAVGMKLLPVLTPVAGALGTAAGWLSKNQFAATALAIVIGGILTTALLSFVAKGVMGLLNLSAGFINNLGKAGLWAAQKIGLFRSVGAAAEKEAVEEGAAAERGEARKLASAVGSGAKWVAVKLANGAKVVAGATMNAAAAVARWTAAGVKIAASAVADGAKAAAGWTTNFAKTASAATVNAARISAAWATNAAKMTASAVADGAKAAAAWTANFVKTAASATVQAGRTAAAWAVQAGKMVLSAAVDGAKFVATMIGRFIAVAASAVVQAAITAAAWVAANIAMIAATGGIVLAIGLLIAAGVWVVTHWQQVKDFFSKLWEDCKRIFSEAIDWVVGIFKDWYPLILGILSGGILLLPALIFKYWDQIRDWFTNIWHDVENIFSTATSWVVDHISSWISNVLNFFSQLPGRIVSALGNLGSLLVNAGMDIVTGLWNGIQRMGSWLMSAITGWIKSVVPGPILSFLGIASPSKWMRDNVGQHIPTGLAEGIKASSHIAEQSATNLAQNVAVAVRNGVSGSDGASLAQTVTNAVQSGIGGTGAGLTAGDTLQGAIGSAVLPGLAQSGGNVTVVHVAPNVQGSVWTTKDLVAELQQELLRHGIRNTGSGITYGFGSGS